jgi:hypothetical protein
MGEVFKVKDPRAYTVSCTEDCWNYHILAKRPWMAGWEDQVIAAISNPDPLFIFQDRDFPDRNIYYRRQSGRPRYLKVVVHFEGETGTVITAHPTDSPKPGEVWIWPKSNA